MFCMENDAADYVRAQGNVVVIDVRYEPSIGDGWLTSRNFLGCCHPVVGTGIREGCEGDYKIASDKGVAIYYKPELKIKAGRDKIQIKLCRILGWRWLELEGASVIPVFNEMRHNA